MKHIHINYKVEGKQKIIRKMFCKHNSKKCGWHL